MKIATGNRINEFWQELKGVLVPKEKVLKTIEEIEANTNEENIAGATALKEVNNKLAHGRVQLVVLNDGKLGYKLDGADTVYPFIDSLKHKSLTLQYGYNTVSLNEQPEIIVMAIYYSACAVYDVINDKYLINRNITAAGNNPVFNNMQNHGKNFSLYYEHDGTIQCDIYYL